jgi:hypothetical protein
MDSRRNSREGGMKRNVIWRSFGAAIAIAIALLALAPGSDAWAQTNDDRKGFVVRELSVSTGYGSVELPPITLQGYLPNDVLNADLITTGTAAIDWQRITSGTRYRFQLFSVYTARARYSGLNAPGGNVAFGLSRVVGNRWRFEGGIASVIASFDQVAFQPTQARRLVDAASSFDDLAGVVALARSPSSNMAHAPLFVPITQSLDEAGVSGQPIVVSSASAGAIYVHSVKLATHVRGNYTTVRQVPSNHDPGMVLQSLDSNAQSAGIGFRYNRSERTQLIADVDWSQTSGVSIDKVVTASVGYGWTGRKWFTLTTVGAVLRPFQTHVLGAISIATDRRRPTLAYSGALGYKFRAQTLLVQYSRASHDPYGHGGRNIVTGFEGNVQSIAGAWSWSAPRGGWMTRADLTMFRGPGNFSYIYTWLSTVGLGRRLSPNVWLMGELLFDRHGSRGFEGFHLTREAARVTVNWTPTRRPVE